jgi:DNA-binding NtrC family response regulator
MQAKSLSPLERAESHCIAEAEVDHAALGVVRDAMAERSSFSIERVQDLLAERPILPWAASEEEPVQIPIGTTLRDGEREIILRTLVALDGNKFRAAKMLGTSRRSVYNKLTEYERAARAQRRLASR